MTDTRILAIMAALATMLGACKRDSESPPTTAADPHHATIRMAFTFMAGNSAYTLDSVLHDSLGHAVKLDRMRFYIGGGHAVNDDEEEVGHYEDGILLVEAGATNDFLLGSIFTSHIHEFHLDLGLDSALNHSDFAAAAAPLNDTAMYFNATDGYRFLVVSGHADADGDGTFETALSYACGTDALLGEAHVHAHHDIVEGETFTAAAIVDVSALFEGIDVIATPTAAGAQTVNARLMVNLAVGINGVE